MPFYDPELNKLVTRIVYDGPGMAGKTTNMRHLAEVFTLSKRSQLHSPQQTAGRTTYFDWLHIDSGLVRGVSMRTQFLTVPGQRVLARRRLALLEQADAVVYVMDGRRERHSEARQMYEVLRERLASLGREVPVVVQVNKQDAIDAMSPDWVRAQFGIPESIPVVGSTATEDLGVRETAILAMRAAAHLAQQRIDESGLDALMGAAGTVEQLQAALEALDHAEVSPVALLLEERISQAPTKPEDEEEHDISQRARRALPNDDVPAGLIWPADRGRSILRSIPVHQARTVRRTPEAITFLAGNHQLATRLSWCFSSKDTAQRELLRLARQQPVDEDAILVISPDPQGNYWLWHGRRQSSLANGPDPEADSTLQAR